MSGCPASYKLCDPRQTSYTQFLCPQRVVVTLGLASVFFVSISGTYAWTAFGGKPSLYFRTKCETMGCILVSLHKPQEEKELLNFTSNFKPRMGFSSFTLNKVVNAENLSVQRLSSDWVHRQLRADNHSGKSSLTILLHG